MDLIRYVLGLAVFFGSFVVLAVCSLQVLMGHAKRKSAVSAGEQK